MMICEEHRLTEGTKSYPGQRCPWCERDAALLQVGELREALKKVDEILVPLLHEQDKRDRHQFLAEFSEVHDPRGIIREALEGVADKPKDDSICKDCGSPVNWPGCVGHPCAWVKTNSGAASYTQKRKDEA